MHTTDNVLFLLDGGSIQSPRAAHIRPRTNSGYSAPKPPREYLADLDTYTGWTNYVKLAFFESKLIFEDSQEIIVLFSVIMPSKYYVWIIFVEAKMACKNFQSLKRIK